MNDPLSPSFVEAPKRVSLRDKLLRRLFRRNPPDGSARETLEELIERRAEEEAPIDPAERALIENALRLRDVTAEDVMVPRADIVAVEADTPLAEVIALIGTCHHSRLPVYRKNLDDVLGMVHVKDILPHASSPNPPPLTGLLREVLFVAPTMRALDLLMRMRLTHMQMALVVDEYGGIDGLATIEDLIEQIVGEIEDEHAVTEPPQMTDRPDGTIIADGRTWLEDFEERVGPVLTEEEREGNDTLGGLVVALVGRVPLRGELVPHASGLEFEVLEADPRRIKRLRIRNVPRPAEVEATA